MWLLLTVLSTLFIGVSSILSKIVNKYAFGSFCSNCGVYRKFRSGTGYGIRHMGFCGCVRHCAFCIMGFLFSRIERRQHQCVFSDSEPY